MEAEVLYPHWVEETFFGKLYVDIREQQMPVSILETKREVFYGLDEYSPPPTVSKFYLAVSSKPAFTCLFRIDKSQRERLRYRLLKPTANEHCALDAKGNIIISDQHPRSFELEVLSATTDTVRGSLFCDNRPIGLAKLAHDNGPAHVLQQGAHEVCEFVIERC
ncbi:hypothetical protein [Pseudomonas sp.]|uniref:hypothetical protein n=1 Tax=Pseudomonas sp. TaxID=306 RepID=UPI0028AE7FF2|nr:hypothetical protein [Pseudomonas sp.]